MSHRITVPDKHIALIVPLSVAMELREAARGESVRARKWGHLSVAGFWDTMRLAAIDGLDEYHKVEFAKEQGHAKG